MTLNYLMVVDMYPNRTEWLAVRYLAMKSSLYLVEISQVVKHLMCCRNIKKSIGILSCVMEKVKYPI